MTLSDTWTLASGKIVTATATLASGGGLDPTISVTVNVPGAGYQLGGVRAMTVTEMAKFPAYSHVCGKLAMTTEHANKVAALVAQLQALPVWQQHVASVAKSRSERLSYDAHRAGMARVMGY